MAQRRVGLATSDEAGETTMDQLLYCEDAHVWRKRPKQKVLHSFEKPFKALFPHYSLEGVDHSGVRLWDCLLLK